MNIPSLLGWAGNLFFITGAIFLARKNKVGFGHNVIGNCFYISQAVFMSNPSLLLLSIVLGFVNIYGYYEWSKK